MPPETDDVVKKSEDYQAPSDVQNTLVSDQEIQAFFDRNRDRFAHHQGAGTEGARLLADHLAKTGLPAVQIGERAEGGYDKPVVRVLEKGAVAGDKTPVRTQIVQPDGKVLTQMPGNLTLEYDPKTNAYTKIDDKGNRTPLDKNKPEDRQLIEQPVKSESQAGFDRKTYADGRIETHFKNPAKGQPELLIQYPPGRPDGLREYQKVTANPDGTNPEHKAAREVKKFGDRTETTFLPGEAGKPGHVPDLKISKVVAYKQPNGEGLTVRTEYVQNADGSGRGPDGIKAITRFAANHPEGLKEKVELPSKPGEPKSEKTSYTDGRSETTFGPPRGLDAQGRNKIVELPGGVTQEQFQNGQITTRFNPPREITLKIDGREQKVQVESLTRKPDGTVEAKIKGQDAVKKVEGEIKDLKIGETLTPPDGKLCTFFADGRRELTPGRNGSQKEIFYPKSDQEQRVTARVYPDRTETLMKNGRTAVDRGSAGQEISRDERGPGGRTDRISVDGDSGLLKHMKLGDTDYNFKFENGKLAELRIKGKDGQETILKKNAEGKWEISPPPKDNRGQPIKDGEVVIDGIKFKLKDGKVVGDIHASKNGDITYKDGDGPDRTLTIKRRDGTLDVLDYKNWERTTTKPGQQPVTKFWDGYGWRDGEKVVKDGKTIITLKPKPGEPGFDPKKPSVLERSGTSGPPPVDKAKAIFLDAQGKETRAIDADWKKQTQTELVPGQQPVVKYYDGSNYREAAKVEETAEGTKITFKPGKDNEPVSSLVKKNGEVVTDYKDARVFKDKDGYVSKVESPPGKPKYEFVRDGDGDINTIKEYGPDGKLVSTLKRKGEDHTTGMGYWASREGQKDMSDPRFAPPRDIGKPTGFNTWVREPGGEQVRMNVFTTADGAVIREKPTANGQSTDVSVEHAGKRFTQTTTDTPTGRRTEFKGPDNVSLVSKDGGRSWEFPGMEGRPVFGTPVVSPEGHTVVRGSRLENVDGQQKQVATDYRRMDGHVSMIDTESRKEIGRFFDRGAELRLDNNGLPTELTHQVGDKIETWKIQAEKQGDKIVIKKVTDSGTPPRTIAEAGVGGKGAIQIDKLGRVVQESAPGSGVFDIVHAGDGTERRETDRQRSVELKDKFKLTVDKAKNPQEGELKEQDGKTWKLEYDTTTPSPGDIKPLKKVTLPGETKPLEKGKDGVTDLQINEATGQITVVRENGKSITVYDPRDSGRYKTEIFGNGEASVYDKAGKRVEFRDRTGKPYAVTEAKDGANTVTTYGDLKVTTSPDGKIVDIASKVGAEMKKWTFPEGASRDSNNLTEVTLPDGTTVKKGPGDELFFKDGQLVWRRNKSDGGKSFQETIFHADGTRSECFHAGHGTPEAQYWHATVGSDGKVASFRYPGMTGNVLSTDPRFTAPPVFDKDKRELTFKTANGEFVIDAGGSVYKVVNGARQKLQSRRGR